jgi:hypothetical protein
MNLMDVNDSSVTDDQSIVIEDLGTQNDEAIKGGPLFEGQLSGEGKTVKIDFCK